jgi:hypothetical protein
MATHYTVGPVHDMPMSLFRALQSELARNGIKETA